MKKNNNTLLKQKTIKNNDNTINEIKITSDDLLNTKANLNYISSGFADCYKNSIKMLLFNLNTLINQNKNDFDINKNFFNNNKNN